MRTFILLGLITIAIAINKDSISDGDGTLIAIVFFVGILMDGAEFLKNTLDKKK